MDDEAIGGLIERVYDLALEPALWPTLVGELASALGAHAGALEQEQMESGHGAGIAVGADPADLKRYFDYYASRNPLRRIANVRELMKTFRPTITVDEEHVPKRELVETEFYVDFLGPSGVHSVMTVGLWHHDVHFVGLDLFRGPAQPVYSPDDVALAGALHPHLIRAFRIGRTLQATRQVNAALAAAVDAASDGVIVLAGDGRVLHANAAAEAMLAAPGGLATLNGRLAAGEADDDDRLTALIGAAVAGRVGGATLIRRPGGRGPLKVTAAPIGSERLSLFNAAPGVLVTVADPDAAAGAGEAALREGYGLTAAQVRVARLLAEGRAPRQIAEALGVSFFTVRAHLAQIFDKTGTSRQAELVSLLVRRP